MSLPRYAQYKDSGVKWLGEVPAQWNVSKVKTVIKAIDSGVSVNAVDTPAGDESVGVLKTSCVYDGTFRFEENKAVLEEELSRVACAVEKDTVIVSRMNTPALVGAAGLVKESRPNIYLPDRLWQIHFQNCAPSFVHYWTLSPIYRYQVEIACAGTSSSMQNLGQDQFKSFWIPLPTVDEQSAIAAFLDRETGKIDALIAEQEKLLTLLAEKRQATISHAVTRGLDPNAPMKDSGIPWLGEVPAHWSAISLKRLIAPESSISYGIVQPGEPVEDGVPFIQTTNMTNGDFSLENLQKTSVEIAAQYPRSRLSGGEVLLGIRASIGAAHIAPTRLSGCNLSRGVARIELDGRLMSSYLVAYFGTSAVSNYWQISKQGSTFNEVSIETVRELSVPVPSMEDQLAIVAFVGSTKSQLDGLQAEAERGIALLKERRGALIAAAVTGKIDVRSKSQTTEDARA